MDLGRIKEIFNLVDYGLQYKINRSRIAVKGSKAGSLVRGVEVVRVDGQDWQVKDLVYLFHHGYWSDYQIINADGNPRNNGILNLLEEGETLVRLNDGRRYDPVTKKYFKRVYEDFTLKHHYEEVND